ncbi:MAG TPA: SMP-30/gluconolactonase/LRE family protein [Sphingomicrobium sp.]|jgi:gluconolactonase
MRRLPIAIVLAAAAMPAFAAPPAAPAGSVEAQSPEFRQLVPVDAQVRNIAGGFTWAEGPVWIANGGYVLLSDVPKNRIYRWMPGERSATIFLEPSGAALTAGLREPGSNGLKPGPASFILAADSGDRAIVLIDLATKSKRILVDRFEGKRLNSPNDIAVGPDGAIWFTDPPYGLDGIDNSPLKEQAANRVYRLAPDGSLTAIESQLRFPNGIAFSPDGRRLYVSNSDPKNAVILAWDVSPDGTFSRRRVFADMNALAAKGLPGLPDGMCIDARGDLWASGPGGIHVLSPKGRELGLISTGVAISNCAFGGPDRRTIYMTSSHQLVALQTKVRGAPVRLPKLAKSMQ